VKLVAIGITWYVGEYDVLTHTYQFNAAPALVKDQEGQENSDLCGRKTKHHGFTRG